MKKPKYLYIAADGPRSSVPGEYEKCQKVRNSIIDQIDWDCNVQTLFNNKNLGCGKGPAKAISWFFDNVEQGIILEDDCLPHPDFFDYCCEMLHYYQENEKIMVISGNNFQDGLIRGAASYYFTAYSNTWGWASWRRAWMNYDFYLDNFSLTEFRKVITPYFSNWNEQQMWIDKFLSMKKRGYDAWDYQFSFHIWRNSGLCINPNVNLVSNIGFGEDATHTNDQYFSALNLEVYSILPLKHCRVVERNNEADKYYYRKFLHKSILQLIWRFIKRNFLKPKFAVNCE
ncbi:MAG: nucleotide-diphospho-sugar transferase [Bacteroidota bacterium]|nr:nucleotide-diphospho-sugar transferase [bacterium]MBU1874762.1 nucleotide-diphospho-sugar transferase [bacterium]